MPSICCQRFWKDPKMGEFEDRAIQLDLPIIAPVPAVVKNSTMSTNISANSATRRKTARTSCAVPRRPMLLATVLPSMQQ
jgi:hypothetical protein